MPTPKKLKPRPRKLELRDQFTVVLRLPDYLQPHGDTNATYITTVLALCPTDAGIAAQKKAERKHRAAVAPADDFAVLALFAGVHKNLLSV